MPLKALLEPVLDDELLTRGLGDEEARLLIDWLVDYGKSNPGTLLYPPNDHLAWLFSVERERLSKVFAMYSPSELDLVKEW